MHSTPCHICSFMLKLSIAPNWGVFSQTGNLFVAVTARHGVGGPWGDGLEMTSRRGSHPPGVFFLRWCCVFKVSPSDGAPSPSLWITPDMVPCYFTQEVLFHRWEQLRSTWHLILRCYLESHMLRGSRRTSSTLHLEINLSH